MPLSPRAFDRIVAGLSAWVIGGFFVDLWAHHHELAESFFTPWHAILYSGAFSLLAFLAAASALATRRGLPVRGSLPTGYGLSLAGMLLFAVAGASDMVWHVLFGVEESVEALFSPTHLLLFVGGILAVGGPLRAAWRRHGERGWSAQGPAVLAVAFVLSALTALTQFVHPVVDTWAERLPDGFVRDVRSELYVIRPDGDGQRRLLFAADENFFTPRWSRDGKSLAFTAERPDVGLSIYVADAEAGARRLVVEDAGRLTWSPDGARIAFHSARGGDFDIYVASADGTDARKVTDRPGRDWAPAWSPDARLIAFTSNREGSDQIYVMAPDGSNVRRLTVGPGSSMMPEWSPEGALIAFFSDRDGDREIYVMDASGSALRQLTENGAADQDPIWSPDGGRIAFVSGRDGNFEVYVMSADGGAETNLTRNPAMDDGWSGMSWSAQGGIAFASRGHQQAHALAFVRDGLGAASVLLQSVLLAVAALFLLTLRPPFGAFTLVLVTNVGLMSVLEDEYRFVPAALAAGLLVDMLYRRARSTTMSAAIRTDVVAGATPGLFLLFYFLTLFVTSGMGWSVHLWAGSVALGVLAGVTVSTFVRLVARRVVEVPPAQTIVPVGVERPLSSAASAPRATTTPE